MKGIKMDKKIILSLGVAAVFCAGIGIGCMVKCCGNKMAVVDVNAIVGKSAQVQVLKNDLAAKNQELTQWLQNAQNEVQSEKNKEKQETLLKQYNAEFVQKRDELSKDYNEKLQAVDKSINETIVNTAKEKGYKSVISKGAVLYGGDDITEEVIKNIK